MPRENWRRRITLAVVAALVLFLLPGCDKVPNDLHQQLTGLKGLINEARTTLDGKATAFNAKLDAAPYDAFKVYSPADLRTDRFTEATKQLVAAESSRQKAVKLADDYDKAQRDKLKEYVAAATQAITKAKALADEPGPWLERLANAKQAGPALLNTTVESVAAINPLFAALQKDVDKAKA